MIRNYVKTAWRNLLRNKVFALINVSGMALALASVILLLLFIRHEFSYDRFYEDSENICRLITRYTSEDKDVQTPKTLYEMDSRVPEQVPEVLTSTMLYRRYSRYIRHQQKNYGRYHQSYADEDFFRVFSLDILKGNPRALSEPNSIVLTKSVARQIFGEEDPLDKVVTIHEQDYRVGAVIQDIPANSHLQFHALLSLTTLDEEELMSHGHDFYTYFLLSQPLNSRMEKKICTAAGSIDRERYSQSGLQFDYMLQPLEKIHLYSDFSSDMAETTSMKYIYIYSVIALFILVVAGVNFINLSFARSGTRTREVGVRKVHGASRNALRWQFTGESLILSLLAFLLAIVLVEVFVDDFSRLVGSNMHHALDGNYTWIGYGLFLACLVGTAAGLYPSFYLAGLNSLRTLKGHSALGPGKIGLQKVLVSFQFFVALLLITSLIGVWNQISYIKNKDLGFQKNNVVVANRLTHSVKKNYESIRQELLKNPQILDVTASLDIPGQKGSGTNMKLSGRSEKEAFQVRANLIKPGFLSFYEIPVVQGRGFSHEMKTDQDGYLISKGTSRLLGMENPVGQQIDIWGDRGRIIGVFDDFHIRSLHHEMDPLILSTKDFGNKNRYMNNFSMKISDHAVNKTVQYIGKVLQNYDPDYTFQYFFLADHLQSRYYRKEEKYAGLMMAGTLMAMIISVMGLFALTAFHINRKVKEIGIRKVMGATSGMIIVMFSKRYLVWVMASALFALPLAHFFIVDWYQKFSFHSQIYWWFYGLSLMITLVVAFFTVLGKATVAANTNPADTLRDE